MKNTGVDRKVDDLGRIVIPSEIRARFAIKEGDRLGFSTEGDLIILQKVAPGCAFCGAGDNVTVFADKLICENCIAKIKAEL